MLSNKAHSVVKISMYQQRTSQMTNLVIVDCCGFKVEDETAAAKKGFLDFSLKQLQDFLLEFPANQSLPAFKTDLARKSKIVRVLGSMFLSNYKMFLLCPVLSYAPPAANKYLLDMIEGVGAAGTVIEAPAPIPKKDVKLVYFSVFDS